jgi:hypothetical protein
MLNPKEDDKKKPASKPAPKKESSKVAEELAKGKSAQKKKLMLVSYLLRLGKLSLFFVMGFLK